MSMQTVSPENVRQGRRQTPTRLNPPVVWCANIAHKCRGFVRLSRPVPCTTNVTADFMLGKSTISSAPTVKPAVWRIILPQPLRKVTQRLLLRYHNSTYRQYVARCIDQGTHMSTINGPVFGAFRVFSGLEPSTTHFSTLHNVRSRSPRFVSFAIYCLPFHSYANAAHVFFSGCWGAAVVPASHFPPKAMFPCFARLARLIFSSVLGYHYFMNVVTPPTHRRSRAELFVGHGQCPTQQQQQQQQQQCNVVSSVVHYEKMAE